MGKPNDEVPVWYTMRTLHKTEPAVTRFLDMEDAKKVTVRAAPREEDARAYLDLALTCHNPEPLPDDAMDLRGWDTLDALGDTARGQTLWQVGEGLYYSLRFEGLTRVCSHQLVRARVGWTFSETCTGDHDWRNGDFLIPRPWMRNERFLETAIQHMLLSKRLYASDIDGEMAWEFLEPMAGGGALLRVHRHEAFDDGSPNIARYILHPALKVFAHARVSLLALSEWYKKRSCAMTQAWEMVILAEKVKEAIIAATPWAAPAFTHPCALGQCWYLKAHKSPLAMANYYRPDEVHAAHMGDWNPKSFLFPDKTAEQMSSGPVAFTERKYIGLDRVS